MFGFFKKFAEGFSRMQYVCVDGERTLLDDGYVRMNASGSGLSVFGINDGSELIVRRLDGEHKFRIDKSPIVLVSETGDRYFENASSFFKFKSYVDVLPETGSSYSRDVMEHVNDPSVFLLGHPYDIDPSGFSNFYTLNHPSLKGIQRMQFIQLCMAEVKRILYAGGEKRVGFDVHRMSVVCTCYGNVMNYRIIPTESIFGVVEFVIADDK